MINIIFILGAILIVTALWLFMAMKLKRWAYSLVCAIVNTLFVILDLFQRDAGLAGFNALVASFWWNDFWQHRPPRMRDKVAKLIGAKARALRDKLVAAMPKAQPVRKPVLIPSGA